MEYRVGPIGDRQVTEDLFKRFLRTVGTLHSEVKLISADDNGAAFTGIRLEMNPKDSRTRLVLGLAAVDGLKVVPVTKRKNT